ncbi:MAG: hypothetical protein J5J06_20180 [Phycisphaerae bacterium]|nr:hypothetical protein [Phycisphaerae bacterium]
MDNVLRVLESSPVLCVALFLAAMLFQLDYPVMQLGPFAGKNEILLLVIWVIAVVRNTVDVGVPQQRIRTLAWYHLAGVAGFLGVIALWIGAGAFLVVLWGPLNSNAPNEPVGSMLLLGLAAAATATVLLAVIVPIIYRKAKAAQRVSDLPKALKLIRRELLRKPGKAHRDKGESPISS